MGDKHRAVDKVNKNPNPAPTRSLKRAQMWLQTPHKSLQDNFYFLNIKCGTVKENTF
jgi:hypothetical protein